MQSTLRVITPPAAPAADIEIAARHIRLESDAERDLFAIYLDAATEQVEKYLCRSLITQTLQWTISRSHPNGAWPYSFASMAGLPLSYDWALRQIGMGFIELPYSPVQSLVSVTTGAWGEEDTLLVAGTDYTSDLTTDPARVRLDPGYAWGNYNHLSITYTAGYGGTTASIPKSIVNAVMMMALNLFENRGDDERGDMSRAVKSLLNPYRIVTYAK